MRRFPQSLFGRLVLILLSGLLLAQLLGTALLLRDRWEAIYQASGLSLAQRISVAIRLLDLAGPQGRAQILDTINDSPLHVSLSEPLLTSEQETAQANPRAALLRALLRNHLSDNRLIRVAIRGEAKWPRINVESAASSVANSNVTDPARAEDIFLPGVSLLVQAQLNDGTWVTFSQHISRDRFALPHRVLLMLAVLLLSVIAVALLAVRWVTTPLSVLADAAETLGKDMQQRPLEESGPLEVRRAAHAFNGMQQRLVSYIQDRTRILAAVSHDLKTPITRLRLRAELIEDDGLKHKMIRDLDDMEEMVSATLDFMHSMDMHEPRHSLDVKALLESLQLDAEEIGQEVHISGEPAQLYPARPLALKRCLTNLISNAVAYGQRAWISVEDDTECLCIKVADEGPGIPETHLERVFEPFFRLEGSRNRNTGGAGLGLSICRNIARAHGGDLSLRNRAEGGLEATLTLPR